MVTETTFAFLATDSTNNLSQNTESLTSRLNFVLQVSEFLTFQNPRLEGRDLVP